MSGRSELLVSAMRASSFCGRRSVPICMSDTTAILYPSNEAGRTVRFQGHAFHLVIGARYGHAVYERGDHRHARGRPIIRAVLPRDSTADMLKGSRATAVIIYR